MGSLIFFIALCYGITLIITQSIIMSPLRMLFYGWAHGIYTLLNCVMCTGFWVGLLLSVGIGYSPSAVYLHTHDSMNDLFTAIFDGAFVSGVLWFIHIIQLNFEKNVQDYI